jgi:hypothetical protein
VTTTHSLPIGVIHESVPLPDEPLRVLLDLVKVVRGVHDLVVTNLDHREILLDGLLELLVLLERVGVVEAEDELALILVRKETVEDSRLEVADVQVS